MKCLGSKTLITDRLILKSQTMDEQKKFWKLLIMPDVNKYYLTVPKKFKDKLNDWEKQREFYEEEIKHSNDNDVFKWSIFLKSTNEYIGKIMCQEIVEKGNDDNKEGNCNNPAIRDVGWLIDPNHQGNGYCYEAAKAMLDFMFNECKIEKIITGAAIDNIPSWKVMDKLGFERQKDTKNVQYTFLDNETKVYIYEIDRERYLKK